MIHDNADEAYWKNHRYRLKPTTILRNLFIWEFLLIESPCCVLNASHLSWTVDNNSWNLQEQFQ
ncbi:hypothetical protein Avbf_05114 [Armadillidium vulgare]|nr:hypothetical protein Avbf_05114 [Armadillidium vulgare]